MKCDGTNVASASDEGHHEIVASTTNLRRLRHAHQNRNVEFTELEQGGNSEPSPVGGWVVGWGGCLVKNFCIMIYDPCVCAYCISYLF
jgi:hypothetical protein